MMYKLTNNSGGQIVCDLAKGGTLRLNNKKSITVNETEITKHIQNLMASGAILSEQVNVNSETNTNNNNTAKKVPTQKSGKEKED